MASKTYHPLVFRLQALTNLHPGGGDSFYGAVDKLVQRDPTTRRPTIHSHSLKGALREFFEQEPGLAKGSEEQKKFVKHVFGSSVSGEAAAAEQGKYRFFSADLLAVPVPDENPNSTDTFHLETSDAVWKSFSAKINHLGDKTWTAANLKAAFQENIPSFDPTGKNFKMASDELPVVARNQLDNGESQNLWYEELVPHQSIFGFVVQAENDANQKKFTEDLHGKVVQIGANATVGYGYCLLTLINPPA